MVYATIAILRLTQFDMTAYDSGIFDNVLWRLGNGHSDVTAITGYHHFSDHMSPLILVAVPVYAIVPNLGLPILLVAQAVSVALVGVAVWLLADALNIGPPAKRAVLVVTLLGAGAYNAAVIDIHEVGLAVGPVAMTAALALRGTRTSRYWVWPALAAIARVDIAVTVLLIGVVLRKEHPAHARVAMWIGGSVALVMGVWLIANPWDGTSFGYHFTHLGIESAGELPGAVLRNPADAMRPLLDPTMWGSLAIWIIAFTAIAPLRAARWIVPAVPTLLIPVLGSWPQADLAHLHYWHVLLPMLAVAMVVGLKSSPQLETRFLYLGAAAILLSWVLMPILKPSFDQQLDDERAVVAFLEAQHPDASVAALGTLVPHISTRPEVMQLPMPFSCPTEPLAAFQGPESPPELVAIPTAVLIDPITPAAARVANTVEVYYEPLAVFGSIEVWRLAGEMPASAYDTVCDADSASENSS